MRLSLFAAAMALAATAATAPSAEARPYYGYSAQGVYGKAGWTKRRYATRQYSKRQYAGRTSYRQGNYGRRTYANRRTYRSYSSYESAGRYGGAGGRPRAWCGWWMRTQLGGGPEYNLARNWRNYGRSSGPQIGAVVVWPHHVGIITGRASNGKWIVKSGNDGGAVRERAQSVSGAVFRVG